VGLNITRAGLRSVLKYPWPHNPGDAKASIKWGFFQGDAAAFRWVLSGEGGRQGWDTKEWTRRPSPPMPALSLEAQIMEWADDVTYAVHDLEDFFRVGVIPLRILMDQGELWEQFRIWLVRKWSTQGKTEPKAGDSLAMAQNILAKYFSTNDLNDEFRRSLAINRFAGEVIHECVTGVKVVFDGPEETPRLLRPKDYEKGIAALKELVSFFVIDGPQMTVSQNGQRTMINAVYSFFHDEASKLTTRSTNPTPSSDHA